MAHAMTVDLSQVNMRFDAAAGAWIRGGAVVGVVGLLASVLLAFVSGADIFFDAYLTNFMYFLSLMLGALFFVLIQHLTKSGWSVTVRRLAEVVGSTAPWLAIAALPIVIPTLLGSPIIYVWANPTPEVLGDTYELVVPKLAYLNPWFFTLRLALYFAVWIAIGRYYLRTSRAQDASGDVTLTQQMQKWSALAVILFGVTTAFAAFDLLMSLKPAWYSTIYGVYYFAGSAVGFFGLLIVMCVVLQSQGRLAQVITPEHYHDLGKLLFAFTVFWAYIAFSQYMLIWYANLAETTIWYHYRQQGPWLGFSLLLLFGHFVLPFLLLISRVPKRRKNWLVIGAAWMLAMHWLDVYYLVKPGPDSTPLHLVDGALFVAFAGFFVALLARGLAQQSLLPERDPRLSSSIAFENV